MNNSIFSVIRKRIMKLKIILEKVFKLIKNKLKRYLQILHTKPFNSDHECHWLLNNVERNEMIAIIIILHLVYEKRKELKDFNS